MANTFKFGNGNWAVKDGYALAYNDENNNFKPLPFDFTRASNATVVNKQGLIETVPSGEPRIDFLDNTSGHLLLEPSRTNSVPYSNDFSQHALTGGSITSDDIVSPDGSVNADTFVEDTNNSQHKIREDISVTSGTYTMSCFVKGTDRFISFYPQGVSTAYAVFDIANESVTVSGGSDYVDSQIQSFENDWYRCSLTYNVGTGTSYTHIYLSNSSTNPSPTYTGNGSEMSFYGLQLEAGSYPTSYIPTEGSSVTRVAETTSQTVPDGIIGQTEGTIFAEINISDNIINTSNDDLRILELRNGSDIVNIQLTDTDTLRFVRVSTTESATTVIANSVLTSGGNFKLAASYKSGDSAFYINGSQIGTSTDTFTFTELSNIYVGNSSSGTLQFANPIKDARIYNTRLTNTELQNLTS